MEINVEGIDKAELLAGLFNRSKPQGLGFIHYDRNDMTTEQAREILKRGSDFDYLQGRVMKIDVGGGMIDTWGYDRDNGEGAAKGVVDAIRARVALPTRDTSGDIEQVAQITRASELQGKTAIAKALDRNARRNFGPHYRDEAKNPGDGGGRS